MIKHLLIAATMIAVLPISAQAAEVEVKEKKKVVKQDLESHEGIIVAMLSTMESLGNKLEGVTDKATAEAAKPELQKIKKNMDKIQKAMVTLGPPAKDKEQALKGKYEKRMEAVMGKMMKQSMRVGSDSEISGVLEDVLK